MFGLNAITPEEMKDYIKDGIVFKPKEKTIPLGQTGYASDKLNYPYIDLGKDFILFEGKMYNIDASSVNPNDWTMESFGNLNDFLNDKGVASIKERIAKLAFGANRDPKIQKEKLGENQVLINLQANVRGYEMQWQGSVTYLGNGTGDLMFSPKCSIDAYVTLMDNEQAEKMSLTEEPYFCVRNVPHIVLKQSQLKGNAVGYVGLRGPFKTKEESALGVKGVKVEGSQLDRIDNWTYFEELLDILPKELTKEAGVNTPRDLSNLLRIYESKKERAYHDIINYEIPRFDRIPSDYLKEVNKSDLGKFSIDSFSKKT